MALTLIVNGQERELPGVDPGASLAAVIGELGLKADRIAVERNGEIARRGSWDDVRMVAGDKLEVVHFVGGGSW